MSRLATNYRNNPMFKITLQDIALALLLLALWYIPIIVLLQE